MHCLTNIRVSFCISAPCLSHLYPLMQSLLIIFVYSQVLCPISIGKLYHWIRGQAMLKLYVLIAIVEVFDRLLCSFGQDAWDSLYWNTTRRPRHPRTLVSVSFWCSLFLLCSVFFVLTLLFVRLLSLEYTSLSTASSYSSTSQP
jgi:hypothetical protein